MSRAAAAREAERGRQWRGRGGEAGARAGSSDTCERSSYMVLMSEACARTSTAGWPLLSVDGMRLPVMPSGRADMSAAWSAESEYVANGSHATPPLRKTTRNSMRMGAAPAEREEDLDREKRRGVRPLLLRCSVPCEDCERTAGGCWKVIGAEKWRRRCSAKECQLKCDR